MKCMYCGGEVPAKSTKCPYCGKENASGIAFMQEVRQKEERNKQLPEKILKKNAITRSFARGNVPLTFLVCPFMA